MPDRTAPPPPDQSERARALDTERSILVQAPAGSGKTDLLTRRFLALLATVDDPKQIVAITFTKAAAAEMRQRILAELERAGAAIPLAAAADPLSIPALAARALERSHALGWQLTDLPAQLRITTIDAFCRELAIQQPLLSGFGADLQIAASPTELYRRAARRTLQQIDSTDSELASSIETLLLWRDNGWLEMEQLIVEMLQNRDRWMHNFVLDRKLDWEALQQELERPFANAVRAAATHLDHLFDQYPAARDEVLALARFACDNFAENPPLVLAECACFPTTSNSDDLEYLREVWITLSDFLQTQNGTWRTTKRLDTRKGFPSTDWGRQGKQRFGYLIQNLSAIPGLESALCAIRTLPPTRYTDDEARILRACFTLLRRAAIELQVVFAEVGLVDFTEVAQIALRALADEEENPSDAAIKLGDEIHHILVDEFQDTSRRQHALIGRLAAAWPDQHGRTLFVVGDPMQSIYFFRDADAELFPRVRDLGLDLPNNEPLRLDPVTLTANFRTDPSLVDEIGAAFSQITAIDDGSGISFSPSQPARPANSRPAPRMPLHLEFVPQLTQRKSAGAASGLVPPDPGQLREEAQVRQIDEIVQLIQTHVRRARIDALRNEKYRIAVLGRTRKALDPIAKALHEAGIPFRAVDLEPLKDRPEILDALALGRALLNPMDRVAWLGVLRAPWSGLSLVDLHTLTSADDSLLLTRAIPGLLAERMHLLTPEGRTAVDRLTRAVAFASSFRTANPNATLGTWIEQVWHQLGGAACVNSTVRTNLDLLWSLLDTLVNGALDVLSSAIDTALNNLKALPDAEAGTDTGVQLMTIHKAKGLEFEVVIVPELQAHSGRPERKLLSWLERGIAQPGSTDTTEFLIAPIQPKGENRSSAQQWVERTRTQREHQEMRRLFYVAATRAREELHLFARPEFRATDTGSALCDPGNSLLATAWPALKIQAEAQFAKWNAASQAREQVLQFELPLAASVEVSSAKPTLLHRLPLDFQPPVAPASSNGFASSPIDTARIELFARHAGGILARTLGSAAHSFMEELSRLRTFCDWPAARSALIQIQPRVIAAIRASGISRHESESIASKALALALQAAADPAGQWLLSPHADAASEASWTGVIDGKLRTVRVDRVFRAGNTPFSESPDVWWIVDYKTAQAEWDSPVVLRDLHALFAPQLEVYAAVLRRLHGPGARIIAALYYPRMLQLDWWEVTD